MFVSRLLRWSGLSLLLGGLLSSLFWIFHPEEHLLLENPGAYQAEHLLGFVGYILFTLGIFGLYARLAENARWIGFAGFIVVTLCMFVLIGVNTIDTFIWPSIAQIQPELILSTDGEFNETSLPFAKSISLVIPASIIAIVGMIFLGVAIWRSSIFPRWAGVLLIVSSALFYIGPGFVPHEQLLINLLVFGPFIAATAWLGIGMVRQ